METYKQIESYIAHIQTLDENWERLLFTMNEAFREKYGTLGNEPLRDLGLSQDYEDYKKEKQNLQRKIQNELHSVIGKLSQYLHYSYDFDELLDYRIPFDSTLPIQESKAMFLGQVLCYLLDFDDNFTLNQRLSKLLHESFFFSILDVKIEKGKAHYQALVKDAKFFFRDLEYFDKKGNITIVGKVIKNRFAIVKPQLKTNLFGFIEESLDIDGLFFDFMNLPKEQFQTELMTIDEDNYEVNLLKLCDMANQLENYKKGVK